MRVNLSLLESSVTPRAWRQGREYFRLGNVKRLARENGGFDVVVQAERQQRFDVHFELDIGDEGAVLEEWDCSCAQPDGGCAHVIAAALALRRNVARDAEAGEDGADGWRDVLAVDPEVAASTTRASWICYDLALHGRGDSGSEVSIVRRRRSLGDKGRRQSGAVIGWKPSAVGHFGYKTHNDAAENRDDLIPVLCSVNRHDLRVRTLQPGFVDVFLRLFVDAEPYTLRVDGEETLVVGAERPVSVIVTDATDGGLNVSARLMTHRPRQGGDDDVLLPGPVAWVYIRAESTIVRPSARSPALLRLLRTGRVHVPADEVDAFCREVLPHLRSESDLIEQTDLLPPVHTAAATPRIRLDEIDGKLSVALSFAYLVHGEAIGSPGSGAAHEGAREIMEYPAGGGPQVFSRSLAHDGDVELWQRDREFEATWLARVSEAAGAAMPALLELDDALDFLIDQLAALEIDGAEVFGRDKLSDLRPSRARVTPTVMLRSGIDWFELKVTLSAGEREVLLRDVLEAWREGSRYIRLDDGELARLPADWLKRHAATLTDLEELAQRGEDGSWRVEQHLAPSIADLVEEHGIADDGWRAFIERLSQFTGIQRRPLPEGLRVELRDYQRGGYDWILALSELGLHGCLADDMGLGKTVQALTVLLADKEFGRQTGPSLIVSPTSVVQNWADEAARFTPDLRVLTLRADDRAGRHELIDAMDDYDIVLTSYALLRQDGDLLELRDFHYVVLDEAQAIKNPNSQTARAVRRLRAHHRLTLTGTPLENNLLELWSQFQFLMPGFFGSRARFVRRYGIVRGGEVTMDMMEQLRRRLRPFVLRRLKVDVDKDLPPLTEVTLRCTLLPPQRELYEKVRNTYRAKVLNKVDEIGLERSTLNVLEALLRLRQTCCHPDLLPFEEAQAVTESAKTNLFIQTVGELLAAGRRILVFSQWTTMLKRLRRELDERGWESAYMDGSTRDRPGVIQSFQHPDGPPLFLISLKAGGVGLNLTAADVVMHYDPWWNPAVEQQASDRAHRIGQEKPVLVIRLVVSDTVEDHILRLQDRKRSLAQAAIDNEGEGVKTLNRDDLVAIFGSASKRGPMLKPPTAPKVSPDPPEASDPGQV